MEIQKCGHLWYEKGEGRINPEWVRENVKAWEEIKDDVWIDVEVWNASH